jgi:hypothetical protein
MHEIYQPYIVGVICLSARMFYTQIYGQISIKFGFGDVHYVKTRGNLNSLRNCQIWQ